VNSAHDCSEGGLAVALAESCFSHPDKQFGATADFGDTSLRTDQLLFNETQGRIVLSLNPTHVAAVLMLLDLRGIPARKLGTVGGKTLKITANGESLGWSLAELHRAWYGSIADAMRA
jgi:phosphoribosylformylglycinamidine (FGAM) synthase-like enzyme